MFHKIFRYFTLNLENILLNIFQASLSDSSDCLKLFVCEVSARPEPEDVSNITEMEQIVRAAFAKDFDEMDATKTTVEFDLASVIGK